jgi:hypothetical protein
MEDDRLQAALLEWEGEGGSVAVWPPERPRSTSPQTEGIVDARHRRGSIGPPAAAAPLGEAASGAALHAHLAQLLDASGGAMAPPPTAPAAPGPELRHELHGDLDIHEDLERQPDGVPHLVIGLTALVSVMFAAVLISILRSGPTLGGIAVAALALAVVPFIVFRLDAKAERDRDHEHPSR